MSRGQALPLALAIGLLALGAAMAVAALGAVQLARSRAQTAADTAAISAGRRLRELLPALAAARSARRPDPAPALAAAARPSADAAGARLLTVRPVPAGFGVPIEVEVRVAVTGPWGTRVPAAARAGLAAPAPAVTAGHGCPVAAAAGAALGEAARGGGVAVEAREAVVTPSGPAAARWLDERAPGFGFGLRDGRWTYLPGCGGTGPPRHAAPRAALPSWVPAAYRAAVAAAAGAAGIPPVLLAAVLQAESGYDRWAVSAAGALGIAQFTPATAADVGLRDPFDPRDAIPAAARLLARHLRAFGSVPLAVAAYNAGPAALRRYGGVPPYAETGGYLARVLALTGGLPPGGSAAAVVLVRDGDALA